MELAAIWRGKLINGYMIKVRLEQAVQHLNKKQYRSVIYSVSSTTMYEH